MSRPQRVVLALVAAVTAAALGVWACWPKRPARPPNVLFVVWDTVRADHLSLYGYDRPTTPRLDAFAEDAAVYERATAPGMWTLNTHAAMFTGLYETSHGAKPSWRNLDERFTTLAELLSPTHDTFAFSANIVVSPEWGVTQGFETVHTSYNQRGQPGRYARESKAATHGKRIPTDASTELSPAFAGDGSEKWANAMWKDAAPVAHQALVDFLAERKDPERPFFAFVNMMEAHTPRLPSLRARERVSDPATIERALATDQSLAAEKRWIVGKRDYSEAELAAIRATYDATLVDLDDATGDLLDDLRQRGILDDTVVVLVADHGESLGEHRMLEHRWTMHEPLLHVPLVIRYPARMPAGRVSARVNTIDLFATVLDLARVPQPEGTFSTSLVGRTAYDPHVYSQMLDPFASELTDLLEVFPDLDLKPWLERYCVVYEGAWKLWYAHEGGHHLYDLDADPHELDDRLAAEPARARALEDALLGWERTLPPYDATQRGPNDGVRNQTDEDRAMAEALGYAEADEPGVGLGNSCFPERAR